MATRVAANEAHKFKTRKMEIRNNDALLLTHSRPTHYIPGSRSDTCQPQVLTTPSESNMMPLCNLAVYPQGPCINLRGYLMTVSRYVAGRSILGWYIAGPNLE